MSYVLGDVTLPRPKSMERKFLEVSQENLTIDGKATRKITNRKEEFILTFQSLSQAVVNSLLSEYELQAVRTFTVDEDNLSIGPTDVLVDVLTRNYPISGKRYLEEFNLVLTEVT